MKCNEIWSNNSLNIPNFSFFSSFLTNHVHYSSKHLHYNLNNTLETERFILYPIHFLHNFYRNNFALSIFFQIFPPISIIFLWFQSFHSIHRIKQNIRSRNFKSYKDKSSLGQCFYVSHQYKHISFYLILHLLLLLYLWF